MGFVTQDSQYGFNYVISGATAAASLEDSSKEVGTRTDFWDR